MSHLFRSSFSKVATVVATTTTLIAVTALATAPLRHPAEIPTLRTVVDTLPDSWPVLDNGAGETFVRTERIQRGDTLASLLSRLDANDPELHRFIASSPLADKLMKLRSGRMVTADIDATGRVHSLQYRFGSLAPNSAQPARRLTIERNDDSGFFVTEEPVPVERQVAMGVAEIQSSLFAAIDAADIPDSVASQVADILQDKVDFSRDLRRGDQLRVLYEMIHETDSLDPPVVGRVLALEFDNNGTKHEAIWFDRGNGQGEYFSFDGRSMKRSFLRKPLEFNRISSRFQSARMHPILKYRREHKGVDFAAPMGTKVRSSGDGVIQFAGRQRGYGKVIIVQHGNHITTLYAHLHGFAADLRVGTRVSQGEVIGYVGATGRATGPHLHYEFMIDGRNVNPLTVALPSLAPLEKNDLKRFTAQAQAMHARFTQLESVKLARFE